MWQWEIWSKFITCCRCVHNSRTCTHIHGWHTNLFQRNPGMELESNPKHVFTLLTDPLIHSKQVRHKVNWATAKRVSGTVARIPSPLSSIVMQLLHFLTSFVSLCCFNSSKAVCKMTRSKRKMHSYISIKVFFFLQSFIQTGNPPSPKASLEPGKILNCQNCVNLKGHYFCSEVYIRLHSDLNHF